MKATGNIHHAQNLRRSVLGQALRKKREHAGLTQMNLADALGYSSAQFISNWERGVSTPPIDAVPTLSNKLGMSAKELVKLAFKCRRIELDAEEKQAIARLELRR